MNKISEELFKKIENKTAHLGVVGMGYVGLPLAIEFGNAHYRVTGLDIDLERVKHLRAGVSYIPDVVSTDLQKLIASGIFQATSDSDQFKTMDVITLSVPTPLRKTKDPDLSQVLAATQMIKRVLRPGQLVILESTTYPGTTEEVILPVLEESGLKAGQEFFLAFSPERVDPGNKHFNTKNTPKIVSGITPECTRLACLLYQNVIDKVIPVSSTKVAEMVKLLENTFRSVNIAMVNEMALMCRNMGINVWEVIDAAATKPFGFLPFYPGPGIGGHCIPVDPLYLSWKARQTGFEPRFIDLASQINGRMPNHVIEKVTDALNERGKCLKNSKILIVGLAYKKDINDIRESPALDIISLLVRRGVQISYHDPYVPLFSMNGLDLESEDLTEEKLEEQDCVIIVTNHSTLDAEKLVKSSRLIMDTRNALKAFSHHHILRL